MEQIKSGENSTQQAFRVMDQIFKNSEPSIPEVKGMQHIKKLEDGTEIIMVRYSEKETEPTGENNTINVDIFNPRLKLGILFAITENGLVNVSIGKNTVSLRSHLYSRFNENLQVAYERSESEKPLAAFRNASEILVGWVKEMVDKDEFLQCPVTIGVPPPENCQRF